MTCLECKHWNLRDSGLRRSGMGPCKLGSVWKFWPGRHTCGKFAQADQAVIDKRRKALE